MHYFLPFSAVCWKLSLHRKHNRHHNYSFSSRSARSQPSYVSWDYRYIWSDSIYPRMGIGTIDCWFSGKNQSLVYNYSFGYWRARLGITGNFSRYPLIAMFKIVCDHVEPLKSYGFLIGEVQTKKGNSSFTKRIKNLFKKE